MFLFDSELSFVSLQMIIQFLDNLPDTFANSADIHSATGAAMDAAHKLVVSMQDHFNFILYNILSTGGPSHSKAFETLLIICRNGVWSDFTGGGYWACALMPPPPPPIRAVLLQNFEMIIFDMLS